MVYAGQIAPPFYTPRLLERMEAPSREKQAGTLSFLFDYPSNQRCRKSIR